MRILGFEKKWPKLQKNNFTTFRFPRKDRDWQTGEEVQIVYKPRSKEREILGIARIINKDERQFLSFGQFEIMDEEARDDGFTGYIEMKDWFFKRYGDRIFDEPMNKLTLTWVMKLTNIGSSLPKRR